MEPEELCRRVLLKLRILNAGPAPAPLPGQNRLATAAILRPGQCRTSQTLRTETWVILGGFNDAGGLEETHVVIGALAEAAGEQDDLRLVMLDYDRGFSDRTERATRRTRIDYLTSSDLDQFLRLLDAKYNVSSKQEWEAARQLVTSYRKHAAGSATQIDALKELFPEIIRALCGHSAAHGR
jgi:hypothetical protein